MSGLTVGWTTAMLGALGALAIAYVNSFLKEQYVRHLDGSSTAAGLAGELSSYANWWPQIRQTLQGYMKAVDEGRRLDLPLRSIPRPKDVFYECNAAKVGLLGVHLAREIAFVYGAIGGFRVAMEVLHSVEHDKTTDAEFRARAHVAIVMLDHAVTRGAPLLEALNKRAVTRFGSSLLRTAR